jgi:hypothetical protein
MNSREKAQKTKKKVGENRGAPSVAVEIKRIRAGYNNDLTFFLRFLRLFAAIPF